MVLVELIDFISHHKNETHIASSDHDQYLLNLLKLKIRKNRHWKFSLQFESVGKLESIGFYIYDIVVSEKHNVLVATQSTYLVIYNRILYNQIPIQDKILFKVDLKISLRCLKLNTEIDQDYLYISLSDETIMKINLTKLLITRENSIIWKSAVFDNVWGIEILNNRMYAVDYATGIHVLDCESGKTLFDAKLPKLKKAFQLVFISPEEMLVSHGHCVEIFHLQEDKWKSLKKTSFQIEYGYIFYERYSQLIFLSNSSGPVGEKVKVINSKDMSLVKSFGNFKMNIGICIDPLSGLLYVCDTDNYYIEVFI